MARRTHLLPAASVLLLGLAARVAAAAGCDCERVSLAPSPVCGTLGITFVNACVAQCQGYEVAAEGPCQRQGSSGSSSGSWPPGDAAPEDSSGGGGGGGAASGGVPGSFPLGSHVASEAAATPETLFRYAAEGFAFAARVLLQPAEEVMGGAASVGRAPTRVELHQATKSLVAADGIFESRLTRQGDLYVRLAGPFSVSGGSSGGAAVEPQQPAGPARRRLAGSRKLRVVGTDDRTEVDSHSYPYSTIGFIGTGCSGALISPTAVLTAGHCVWNATTGDWSEGLGFYPNLVLGGAEHCHGSDCYSQRFVDWDSVSTMFNNANPPEECDDGTFNCHQDADFVFDFAVIMLKEDLSSYGNLGIKYACEAEPIPVATAGYPADLVEFSMYTTTGTLEAFPGCVGDWDVASGVITSDLDTAPGQSGSSIWDSEYYVRAIHVNGNPGHRSVNEQVFGVITGWLTGAAAPSPAPEPSPSPGITL